MKANRLVDEVVESCHQKSQEEDGESQFDTSQGRQGSQAKSSGNEQVIQK